MKILYSFFLFAVVFFLGANDVLGCSCKKVPDQIKNDFEKQVAAEFDESEFVFSGVVTRIQKKSGLLRIKFSVDKIWKGKQSKIVFVSTAPFGTLCGFPFKLNKKYVVYARTSEEGVLQTNSCSRTAEIKNAGEDLKYLDKSQA